MADPRRRHLRDVNTMCPAIFNTPGETVRQCQLEPGHDGLHAYECSRWGDAHSKRPTTAARPSGDR